MSGKVHDLEEKRKHRASQAAAEAAAAEQAAEESAHDRGEHDPGEKEALDAAVEQEAVEQKAVGEEAADNGGDADHHGDNEAEAALQDALEQAEAARKEVTDRLVRLQADFENFRRRTRQEMEGLRETGHQDLMTELLPVLDNLERALAAADSGPAKDDPVASGVRMVAQQFRSVLEKHGLTVIPSVGEGFDPRLHEAVAHVEAVGDEADQVVEELQRGYFFKSKVLRPAMVKVARSPD